MSTKAQVVVSVVILLFVGALVYVFVNPTFQKNRVADVKNNPVPNLDSNEASSAPAGTSVLLGSTGPSQELAPTGSSSSETIKPIRMSTTASGLEIAVLKEGSGAEAKAGDTVTVLYTGTFTDGTKFDSSVDRGQPFSFPLGQGRVIAGWDEGVSGMKAGEKRKLTIPYQLGYGEAGYGPIPPKATLIFEVELLKIN